MSDTGPFWPSCYILNLHRRFWSYLNLWCLWLGSASCSQYSTSINHNLNPGQSAPLHNLAILMRPKTIYLQNTCGYLSRMVWSSIPPNVKKQVIMCLRPILKYFNKILNNKVYCNIYLYIRLIIMLLFNLLKIHNCYYYFSILFWDLTSFLRMIGLWELLCMLIASN